MKNIQTIALAFIVGTGFLILEARVRKLEADAMERSAASSLEYRRAQIRKLVNSQLPESIEIYRSLLARGIEVIRVERTGPGICAVTARDPKGKSETFYGVRGSWPEGPLGWTPKIGDRVQTTYGGGAPLVTTVTNVVYVGSRSQSGLLVYGDGLPGVDSWWVKPAASHITNIVVNGSWWVEPVK